MEPVPSTRGPTRPEKEIIEHIQVNTLVNLVVECAKRLFYGAVKGYTIFSLKDKIIFVPRNLKYIHKNIGVNSSTVFPLRQDPSFTVSRARILNLFKKFPPSPSPTLENDFKEKFDLEFPKDFRTTYTSLDKLLSEDENFKDALITAHFAKGPLQLRSGASQSEQEFVTKYNDKLKTITEDLFDKKQEVNPNNITNALTALNRKNK